MRRRDANDIPGLVRTIRPNLPSQAMVLINAFLYTYADRPSIEIAQRLRGLYVTWKNEGWSLELRAIAVVLADLVDQGWWVTPVGRSIQLEPPGEQLQGESTVEAKTRLRQAFRIGRLRQLQEPAVARFLKRMHRSTLRAQKQTSIADLIDDGREFVPLMRRVALMSSEAGVAALEQLVRPVVQVCDSDAKCEHTGLRLLDIWRYFRHTWSMEYRSIPGRQLPLLVRNSARPNWPVIGIALLASPVVRTRPRDEWIGWTPDAFIRKLQDGSLGCAADVVLRALLRRIDRSLHDIRTDDLQLTAQQLAEPSFQTVVRIHARAGGAAIARQRVLRSEYQDMLENGKIQSQFNPTKRDITDADWRVLSEDPLFVYKRADTLWRLLAAKRVFLSLDWRASTTDLLRQLLEYDDGKQALATALLEVRKAGLSSQVADLSICGAIAPYNHLMGGKLVALLMTSVEVREMYRQRYGEQISIISSQMAGRPISKPADLKVLTTTSLYGTGSSQYNRLKLRAAEHPELAQDIEWKELSKTLGYGTYHLSPQTVKALRLVSERAHGARRVNNRFGEGASPRLRQTREGLEALGIDSTQILHHATPRLFYASELHVGAIQELLGVKEMTSGEGCTLSALATAWRRRWLLARVQRPEIVECLTRADPAAIKADMMIADGAGQFEMMFSA